MPEQILLQGKILGTEEFLLAGPAEGRSVRSAGEELLAGRSQWITLLGEVLPRTRQLGLACCILGSMAEASSVVLPAKSAAAENFSPGRPPVAELSSGHVKLIWGITDNWVIGPSSESGLTAKRQRR
jgi:hypothetical protein